LGVFVHILVNLRSLQDRSPPCVYWSNGDPREWVAETCMHSLEYWDTNQLPETSLKLNGVSPILDPWYIGWNSWSPMNWSWILKTWSPGNTFQQISFAGIYQYNCGLSHHFKDILIFKIRKHCSTTKCCLFNWFYWLKSSSINIPLYKKLNFLNIQPFQNNLIKFLELKSQFKFEQIFY